MKTKKKPNHPKAKPRQLATEEVASESDQIILLMATGMGLAEVAKKLEKSLDEIRWTLLTTPDFADKIVEALGVARWTYMVEALGLAKDLDPKTADNHETNAVKAKSDIYLKVWEKLEAKVDRERYDKAKIPVIPEILDKKRVDFGIYAGDSMENKKVDHGTLRAGQDKKKTAQKKN